MIRIKSMGNLFVITVIVFMIALTAVFILSNVYLKNKIVFRIVQQTELISELIARSAVDIMSVGHGEGKYAMVLAYGNMIGVDDTGIYRLDGQEAFAADGGAARRIDALEREGFKNALSTSNRAGFFNWQDMTYSRYVPLRAEGACTACHRNENEVLGVLRIRLSTESDFELLSYVRKLIWTLGLIVCLPVVALIVAGAIIRDKNRIYAQLKESNYSLTKTYDELDEIKYHLQMILDNSRVIIVTTDMEGRIVEFNREAESLLGYRKEEVAGKDVLMLYENPHQRPVLIKKGKLASDEVWEVRDREVALRSKSGHIVHVLFTLSTMVDEEGSLMGTVGVGKDVSEQKMLQFKLLQSEKLAGIGTLASGIAHEINNPLAGILGMAEAIKDEDDLSLMKSYAEDIIQYTVTASSIVRELSAYSRSAHNESSSTVDMAAVIENSLKMAKHSASSMAVELVTDLKRDCFIIANHGEIQQVFVNLIINAIHAMGERGTLTLRCWREGAFVKAQVSDTGHGIPEKNLSQIYDPFFTTKPVGMGTGLGLYVVYRIVTKHKGTIDVESREGGGTTFTLKFPSTNDKIAAGSAA